MPWCPVCKNEYVEGIKVCADCNVELVDVLEEMKPVCIANGTEEKMQRLHDFLKYNDLKSAKITYNELKQNYDVTVEIDEVKKAKKIALIFSNEENLKEKMKNSDEALDEIKAEVSSEKEIETTYVKKRDKAENFKTSAYTLVGVGILGMIVLILCVLRVLPFQLGLLTEVVMGVLFLIFICVGISSYKSYRVYEKEAVVEENLKSEIEEWCRTNLSKETIDSCIDEDELNEELKYFKRIEKMKELVSKTFLNLEDGFLDSILEEIYNSLYDEN